MARIFKSIDELIGNTPLLELTHFEELFSLKGKIFAKLEFLNPGGSIKDRAAKNMLDDAEEKGILKKGAVIIEPTSGNTGIGLALVGTARGYRCIIVMPDSMSVERIRLMEALGAEVVLTEGAKGMNGAIEKANELSKSIPGSFIAGQFENPANAEAHVKTTGPEIFEDTDGELDYLVSAIGTGGTITGTGRYLKDKIPGLRVIGVEPESSPVLSKGISGKHGIQGIGAGFVPEVLDTEIYDEIIRVSDEDAFETGRLMARKEGVLCGISSGAAVCAAIKLAKREENTGKRIAVILPDTADRYMSTALFG
ncbi:MAG: cysteine synthase A [Clostridia bacterium]|nr:cysteine synthase A [Clostridia bacterium]MBQ5904564.1 cysteine synthase A [Clostridia bacterium]